MRPVLSVVSAGLVAGAMTTYAGTLPIGAVTWPIEAAVAAPTPTETSIAVQVERAKKGDRLTAPAFSTIAARHKPEIATMEVIGGNGTSVVYRDRSGRILFEADPSQNQTIVAKDVKIPEVTVRSESARVKHETRRSRPTLRKRAPQPPAKLLSGCDPMFSPITDPALANLPGRCLASASGPII